MARRTVVTRGHKRSVKVWLGPAEQGYVAVADNTKVLLASTGGFGLGSAGTIIRTRGLLSIRPTTEGTSVSIDGAFGIAIVSATALGTGITAIPGPFTDSDWSGWFVHQFFAMRYSVATNASVQVVSRDVEVDSKAMRKVAGDEAIVLVGESRQGAVSVLSHMRLLFQES